MSFFKYFCRPSAKVAACAVFTMAFVSACTELVNPLSDSKGGRDATYVAGIPAPVDSNASGDCSFQRPDPEDLLARPYVNELDSGITLFAQPNSRCSTSIKPESGQAIQVIARKGDWVYVQNTADSHEGWATPLALGPLIVPIDCIDLELGSAGVRFKNVCDRDIAQMRICLTKGKDKDCRTNWRSIDGLAAGKTRRISNMPRPTGQSWWRIRACFEPSELSGSESEMTCRLSE